MLLTRIYRIKKDTQKVSHSNIKTNLDKDVVIKEIRHGVHSLGGAHSHLRIFSRKINISII